MSRVVVVAGWEFNTESLIDGVEWEITEVSGMGEPAAVFASEQRVGQDGVWATTGYRAARAVGLAGVIRAGSAAQVELASDQLRNLISLAEFPITLRYASGDRTVYVRRDGEVQFPSRDLPTEQPWSCVLKAVDPAIYAGGPYGEGVVNYTTGLPQSTSGVVFPATFPVTFAGSSSSGDVTVTGGGRMLLQIVGPVTDPSIVVENSAGLRRLAWLGSISAGMWLDVDPANRSALLQGQSSRVPFVRQWPQLVAGSNIIRFRAAEYSAGRLNVSVRPTL